MPRKSASRPQVLDRKDRAILAILQRNSKMRQREIAEQVHLSAAAVQRRIAAMEASGVILRNVAIIDPAAVGVTITSIVEVHLVDEHARTVDTLKALFRATPEIQQCYYVTGWAGIVLIIVAPDMLRYAELARQLFAKNELVKSYRSIIVLDRVKVDSAVVVT